MVGATQIPGEFGQSPFCPQAQHLEVRFHNDWQLWCSPGLKQNKKKQMFIKHFKKRLTTSRDSEARILLNSFFASFLFSLYIAFDNCWSFTLVGISTPIASQSKTVISVRSFSMAILIGESSFSSVVAFASTLQKRITYVFWKWCLSVVSHWLSFSNDLTYVTLI